ncbi:MAG: orotidine-5-phosphate decarboxylase [Planctomycetota bacterium]
MALVDFGHDLANKILHGAAPAVVGLDPRLDALPAGLLPGAPAPERLVAFYARALPALARHVPVVKPNIAFFECYGSQGFAAWERVCADARAAGLLVLGDIKRGDIGSTAEAYAEGHFQWSDAVTLHPYLGRDSIDPFLKHCKPSATGRKAVFVLARTSNPGARDFQDLKVDGEPLCDRVARTIEQWNRDFEAVEGYGPIGAVVGATWPEELARLRKLMPSAWLLLPGVGAQGGKVADLAAAFDRRGLGALVSQSRGVMQAFKPADPDWLTKVEAAAAAFAAECLVVSRGKAHA